jgi:hypothetical protein
MKPTLKLTLIAALALAGCSRTDVSPVARAAVRSAEAAQRTLPQYPPLEPDARDGAVFEFY